MKDEDITRVSDVDQTLQDENATVRHSPSDTGTWSGETDGKLSLSGAMRTPSTGAFGRYENLQPLGAGGAGVVYEAYDPNLDRVVALKALHADTEISDAKRARFIGEARVMAKLEHPNIVPVHEINEGVTGRIYFTMKRVRGVTLQSIIEGLDRGDPEVVAIYTPVRLIDIFQGICDAMGFAHDKGYIHRDLKPENILVGDFGEVQVMDWGLQKRVGEADPDETLDDREAPMGLGYRTMVGTVAGTPRYMSPEQGRGEEVDHRSDLYSLGLILYELLTQKSAIEGTTVEEILEKVKTPDWIPPRERNPVAGIPRELEAICMHCLRADKEQRYGSVMALLADIRRYRHGEPVSVFREPWYQLLLKWCKRHPVLSASVFTGVTAALVLTVSFGMARQFQSRSLMSEGDHYRAEGDRSFVRAVTVLESLDALRVEVTSRDLGRKEQNLIEVLEDEEAAFLNDYEKAMVFYSQAARFGQSTERRAAMISIYQNRFRFAEMESDTRSMRQIHRLLAGWFEDRPEALTVQASQLLADFSDRVSGLGQCRVTAPKGVDWRLVPLRDEGGRWVEAEPLPATSSAYQKLQPGPYLVRYKSERAEAIYSFVLGHSERMDIVIDAPVAAPEGYVFIPEGPYWRGGAQSRQYRQHQAWLPNYFISRYEVTFKDYLRYWRSLDSSERERDMGRVRFDRGQRAYQDAWNEDGVLIKELKTEWPVVGVTVESAMRYCAWWSAETGRSVRLPSDAEWEKAARGGDARLYPWGQGVDSGWAFTSENRPARVAHGLFAKPGSLPFDRSVYGVMDLGGNVREWTGTRFEGRDGLHMVKGASASVGQRFLYSDYASDTPVVPTDVGFRTVIEFTAK